MLPMLGANPQHTTKDMGHGCPHFLSMGVGAPGPYSLLAIQSNGITSVGYRGSAILESGIGGALLMHYPCDNELVCIFLRIF